ncbi:glycosyltransferase family 9 protein [Ramlibacter sp. USB13]|uniref:Glycosyltransferase family 9 protein n=1 Tax=Ramlibacter cellulosilyticus TaxID=2764187 RepID=A0A923MTY5_9BURK|nr:glycosyltransferase family 9 protein [Ramlibacter cellulosilyticus]MBC5785345.1 glycosyltransferase family 9 protein [Ramlibacter cellulosilyticus]
MKTGEVRSILVVVTRQIGDVLLTTPLIAAAHERWPAARIDVLAFAGTGGMLHGNPAVSGVIEVPARLGWAGGWRLLKRLFRRYDLGLVAQPSDRAHLLALVAARVRSGLVPEEGGSNWWKKALLRHAVPIAGDRGEVHVVAEKMELLAPWVDPLPAPRVVPPAGGDLPADVQARLGPRPVVVHAPSMWAYKQWPLAQYRELVAGLLAAGHQVVLTGSGSARDQECVAALRDLGTAPALLDVSGRLDFTQVRTLLSRAALYIGPDTSVSHLAASVGVPVLAVFGPTNPQRWAPWPAQAQGDTRFARVVPIQQVGNVTLFQGSQDCVPCGRAGCDDHLHSRSECLESIPAQRVLQEALRRL